MLLSCIFCNARVDVSAWNLCPFYITAKYQVHSYIRTYRARESLAVGPFLPAQPFLPIGQSAKAVSSGLAHLFFSFDKADSNMEQIRVPPE